MQSRRKKYVLAGLFVGIVSLCSLWILYSSEVQVVPLGHGRLIAFYDISVGNDSCGRTFRVRDYFGRLRIDGCWVESCYEPMGHTYSVISSENPNVIGVLDYELNHPVLMCDFSLGKCSPCKTSESEQTDMFNELKEQSRIAAVTTGRRLVLRIGSSRDSCLNKVFVCST